MNKSDFKVKLMDHTYFMKEAIIEAKKSLSEGGIPIGAVLVKDNEIISRGHNKLIQNDSVILHAEMDCIESAGRLTGKEYKKCTLYTTLSPCPMCSGAVVLYNIPRVVIGENNNLQGAESFLKQNCVEVINLAMSESNQLLDEYIKMNPDKWELELEKVSGSTECMI